MSTEQVPILTARDAQAQLDNGYFSIENRSRLQSIANESATVIATAELEALRRDAEQLLAVVKHCARVLAECNHSEQSVLNAASARAVAAIKRLDPSYYGLSANGQ